MKNPPACPEEGNAFIPVFGKWRNAYLLVIAFFVFDVVLFYAFGRYFS